MQQLDRSQGIGCSDIPVIMGVSPYKKPYELWQEKVTGIDKTIDNPAMAYGREREPIIREMIEIKIGIPLHAARVVHPEKPWLWASLDGYNEEKGIIAEFKTAKKSDHIGVMSQKIPEKYWPQIQGQMEVTGLKSILYCSYYEDHLEVVEVPRDPEYCQEMMDKVQEFWEMVVTEVPPEMPYVCMDDDKGWCTMAKESYAIVEQIKALEERKAYLTGQMKLLSNGVSAKGGSLYFHKQKCEGAIDYKTAIDDYISNMKSHYPQVVFPEVPLSAYKRKSFDKWTLKSINNK